MEHRLTSGKETKTYYRRIQKMSYIAHCPNVYNLAQKLDNAVQIVRLLVTHDGGRLFRVGELSLAERLQGRQGNPLVKVTLALN